MSLLLMEHALGRSVGAASQYINNAEDKVRAQGAVLGGTFLGNVPTFGARLGLKF
ncbi:hypothetical protein [Phenylobacterium montanum]|uniref:Uncharacterized protein n=1 Tax=Phenylobacterium montanum TaxID=2823693 RepID=A0A975G3J9_9CAUL|nr:hypothetical protein [Caulobacter sp. S6]QUD90235.1 hypothetical protein KCG34_10410 [Caulobacter sp. S6]